MWTTVFKNVQSGWTFASSELRNTVDRIKKGEYKIEWRVTHVVPAIAILTAGAWLLLDCDVVTFVGHLKRRIFSRHCMRGKRVWLIGVSTPMGSQLACRIAEAGAECLVISAKNIKDLERVKSECERLAPNCRVVVCALDTGAFEDCRAAMNTVMDAQVIDARETRAQFPNASSFFDVLILNPDLGQSQSSYPRLSSSESKTKTKKKKTKKEKKTEDGTEDGSETDEKWKKKCSTLSTTIDIKPSVYKKVLRSQVAGTVECARTVVEYRRKLKKKKARKQKSNYAQNPLHLVVTASIYAEMAKCTVVPTASSELSSAKSHSANGSLLALSAHALYGYFEAFRVEILDEDVSVGVICPGLSFSPLSTAYGARRSSSVSSASGLLGTDGMDQDTDSELRRDALLVRKGAMDATRASQLYLSAVYNRHYESWMARRPQIFCRYVHQYVPLFSGFVCSWLMPTVY